MNTVHLLVGDALDARPRCRSRRRRRERFSIALESDRCSARIAPTADGNPARRAYGSCMGARRGRADPPSRRRRPRDRARRDRARPDLARSTCRAAEKLGDVRGRSSCSGVLAALRVRMPAALPRCAGRPVSPRRPCSRSAFCDVESVGLFVLLAVYSGAAHTSGRRTIAAGALTIVLALDNTDRRSGGDQRLGIVFFAFLFGCAVGRRADDPPPPPARARSRAGEATPPRTSIAEERARIARELHDVVAHAISVIVLQARGGRRLLDIGAGRDSRRARHDRARRPAGARRDAPARRPAARERRAARARSAAEPLAPRRARRPGARGRPARRAGGRGRSRRAAARRRPLRLPDRPGGAHERAQARRARSGARPACVTSRTASRSRSPTTAPGAPTAPVPATASRESASAWPSTAASSRRAGAPRAATPSARACRTRARGDPRPPGRRPVARPRRVPDDPQDGAGHRGRRRGGRRERGRRSRRASSRPTSC